MRHPGLLAKALLAGVLVLAPALAMPAPQRLGGPAETFTPVRHQHPQACVRHYNQCVSGQCQPHRRISEIFNRCVQRCRNFYATCMN